MQEPCIRDSGSAANQEENVVGVDFGGDIESGQRRVFFHNKGPHPSWYNERAIRGSMYVDTFVLKCESGQNSHSEYKKRSESPSCWATTTFVDPNLKLHDLRGPQRALRLTAT